MQLQEIKELLLRYDRPGPRYTSYPTAVEFTPDFTAGDYAERLSRANRASDAPLSIYVHVPFCEERCHFCGCHVIITRKREVAAAYLDHLEQEIDIVTDHLPDRRGVAQLHFGGGTPTYLSGPQIERVTNFLLERFHLLPGAEVAIEIDPRVTTPEQIRLLHDLGFNRISMGVQDFTPEVQELINRNQTFEGTRDQIELCRSLGFDSLNLDLIYGLPGQTVASFDKNLDDVLSLRPDRVAVYSYAHVPWLKAHQKRLVEQAPLPDAEMKLELFARTIDRFREAGYEQIGMDHFALAGDDLTRARNAGTLHRNFMGYTTKPASDMIAFGISGIGDIAGSYVQNEKKLSTYQRAVSAGELPVLRGFSLSTEDERRRDVITRLMCNFHLDTRAWETRWGLDFASHFASELEELAVAEADGLVKLAPDAIRVTEIGRLAIRNICMVFDAYLAEKEKSEGPVFSRTI